MPEEVADSTRRGVKFDSLSVGVMTPEWPERSPALHTHSSKYISGPTPMAPKLGTKIPLPLRSPAKKDLAVVPARMPAAARYHSTEYHTLTGPAGDYTITLKVRKGLYTPDKINKFLEIIEKLNSYVTPPMQSFVWDLTENTGEYHYRSHSVHLNPEALYSMFRAKSTLVHEMGHGIYAKKLHGDEYWESLYKLSLKGRNFEIIDDASYGAGGHPRDNHMEAFAAAVHAYFLHADVFSAWILDSSTPESQRVFGRLVWCFMRDRVFDGDVFTSDGSDPCEDDTEKPPKSRLRGPGAGFAPPKLELGLHPSVFVSIADASEELGAGFGLTAGVNLFRMGITRGSVGLDVDVSAHFGKINDKGRDVRTGIHRFSFLAGPYIKLPLTPNNHKLSAHFKFRFGGGFQVMDAGNVSLLPGAPEKDLPVEVHPVLMGGIAVHVKLGRFLELLPGVQLMAAKHPLDGKYHIYGWIKVVGLKYDFW